MALVGLYRSCDRMFWLIDKEEAINIACLTFRKDFFFNFITMFLYTTRQKANCLHYVSDWAYTGTDPSSSSSNNLALNGEAPFAYFYAFVVGLQMFFLVIYSCEASCMGFFCLISEQTRNMILFFHANN